MTQTLQTLATPDEDWRVAIDGFEGPLDALLALARTQKIDLRTVSLARLTQAYVEFLQSVQILRPDVASAHAVSAAWLVYLKSRLLLPADTVANDDDDMSPEEAAARLQAHLLRLEQFRNLAEGLANMPQLGRDFFARTCPEAVEVETVVRYDASLYALMMSYGRHHKRTYAPPLNIGSTELHLISSVQANTVLTQRLATVLQQWTPLQNIVPSIPPKSVPLVHASAMAACLAACLEAARNGVVLLRQEAAFTPIEVKAA